MADNGKSKSLDSDKAALGRKLLNKHQKSKTARSNTNAGKQNLDNIEGQAHNMNTFTEPAPTISGSVTPELDRKHSEQELHSMPIQQYFNIPNNNNFFDLDQVAIDDPELKQNEIYNLQHPNISKIITPQYSREVVETAKETSPNYDDSQLPTSESEKTTSVTPTPFNHTDTDTDLMLQQQQQLAIDSLQSQLQQQVLTNSHLLGDNSELQGELNHARSIIAQHTEQVNQLKVRIESSDNRLAESQRQLDASRRLAEDWQVKAEEGEHTVTNVRKERDIALQDASELLERLGLAQAQDERTKEVLGQVRGQLDMANIRIQQLVTAGNTADNMQQQNIDSEAAAASSLVVEREKQLADVQVALEATRSERDIAAQQYQLYNSQLSEQVATLQADLHTLHATTDHLTNRERDLVAHIGDMERLLQNHSNSATVAAPTVSGIGSDDDSAVVLLLQQQCNQVTERLQAACAERDEALRELHKLSGEVEELHELRNSQQVDSLTQAKLLEEIRSDKVAASRAIEQNLVLKAQVTEMEAAYLTVTQDKVAPLTDQLVTAKHQLQQYERNLRTLHDAVEMKDRELEQMRVCETQVAHLTDRLRHYEAIHEHGAPSIQSQLQTLQHENDRLRRNQLEQQPHQQQNHSQDHDECEEHEHDHEHDHDEESALCNQHHHNHHHHHKDTVDTVVGAIDREDELQQEIFQLKQQLDELRKLNVELVSMQEQQEEEEEEEGEVHVRNTESDEIVTTKRLSKAKAAQQLEHKFTRTMEELASLNDEKQRLEHLVLQLQGETETIGEYVALYQRQRSLLAQRSAARAAQLRHLQERLADLAVALEDSPTESQGGRIAQLLHEIRTSNAELMLEQPVDSQLEHQQQQHGGGGMEGMVSCGGGCAWCQGKLITV